MPESIGDKDPQDCSFCKKPKVFRDDPGFDVADLWIELDLYVEQMNGQEDYAIGAHLRCVPPQFLLASIMMNVVDLENNVDEKLMRINRTIRES